MPAAQGSLSPPLPTAEVFEMGTDVAAVPRGSGDGGMQVCVICAFASVSSRRCVRVAAPGSDLCLSVFVCQTASSPAARWTVVRLKDEARAAWV